MKKGFLQNYLKSVIVGILIGFIIFLPFTYKDKLFMKYILIAILITSFFYFVVKFYNKLK